MSSLVEATLSQIGRKKQILFFFDWKEELENHFLPMVMSAVAGVVLIVHFATTIWFVQFEVVFTEDLDKGKY